MKLEQEFKSVLGFSEIWRALVVIILKANGFDSWMQFHVSYEVHKKTFSQQRRTSHDDIIVTQIVFSHPLQLMVRQNFRIHFHYPSWDTIGAKPIYFYIYVELKNKEKSTSLKVTFGRNSSSKPVSTYSIILWSKKADSFFPQFIFLSNVVEVKKSFMTPHLFITQERNGE